MSFPDFEQAKRVRDKRLRRQFLIILHAARPNPISGQTLSDMASYAVPESDGPEDADHVVRLASDLAAAEYVEMRDTRQYRREKSSLATFEFEITAKGVALIEEAMPPDPLIDDPRI